MSNMTRRIRLRTNLRDNRRVLRGLLLSIPVLLLFGMAARGTAISAAVPNAPAASVGPGAQFAIADLDGDLRPDLASIQAEPNSSGTTNYWIQLQLSTSGWQSIPVVAPAGGLRIETRDVNGDNAIDLVLAEAWFDRPVAIFLNNGHGGFSRAEPNAFPGAFREAETIWSSTAATELAMDAVGVPPQSGARIQPQENDLRRGQSPARWISGSTEGFAASPFLVSQAGRAPPSEVPQL
jgi:hypothetical protein